MMNTHSIEFTFSIGGSSDVKLGNVVGWGCLDPDLLPDTRAWSVEDVAGVVCLLSDGDALGVGGIADKDEPAKVSTCTLYK